MKRCLKRWLYVALALAVVGCASQKVVESSNASKDLEDRYSGRVGAATKTDFVQEFGNANWCRPQPTGEETCRFYKKLTVKWDGEKTDRTHREAFDEMIADFDQNGVLKSFKANSQR